MQPASSAKFALAGVERAEFGRAQHPCRRHMENIQAPAANRWGVAFSQGLSASRRSWPHKTGLASNRPDAKSR